MGGGIGMLTQRPRGTADLLPGQIEQWQRLEEILRETFRRYNYHEIRTPIFEHTELFSRGVGDTTDIVEKEMYTFQDRGDRSVTLRPEGTAGVVRAFVENKLYGNPGATKLYYAGPMFRYEKPQKGRWRQFHQYGAEVLGSEDPSIDAEVIGLNLEILTKLGLQNLSIELNSVGCGVCRPIHKAKMVAALEPVRGELCRDCQSRLDRNPLRIFDCKNEHCQALLKASGAPKIIDVLCEDCVAHFAGVKTYLNEMEIPYTINDTLVRGLDYYTRTAWEVVVVGYSSVAGGGRYNSLTAQLGGPETPGIGFAGGIERALLVLAEQTGASFAPVGLDVFIAVADAAAAMTAAKMLYALRQAGLTADRDYQGKSLKAQFKAADRARAAHVVVLGENELAAQAAAVKDLQSGWQEMVLFHEVVSYLKEKVK